MKNKFKLKGNFKTKKFKNGSYSFILSAIVVAIVIAINLIVNAMPSTVTKFDVSDQQLTKISQETKDLLKSLDKNVTLYLIAENGSEENTIVELLDRYKAMSSHITIEQKDPAVNPTFTSKYTSEDVSANSVIVECGDNFKVVDYNDIYQSSVDYSTYETTTSFDGEGQITSAIDYVTSDSLPVAYTLSGHSETELSADMTSAIEKQNISIKSLDLLSKGSVPDDCGALMIIGPQKDLSQAEAKAVITYLKAGGKVFIATSYTDEKLPNFNSVLEEYGVELKKGLVIDGDSNYYASPYPDYLLPTLSTQSEVTSTIASANLRVLVPIAQAIIKNDSADDTITYTSLLSTSDSAYVKLIDENTKSYEKEDGDEEGTYDVSLLISQPIESETESENNVSPDTTNEDTDQNSTDIILVSSAYIFDDNINQSVSGANQDFIINSLGLLCEHESAISIHAKSLDVEYLTISAGQISTWSILLMIVIPVITLIAGLIIWIRRRRM